tara:strand:+ start:738 stop:1019 length:282 start_codon:yes stop_codon:yes gene_type:complete
MKSKSTANANNTLDQPEFKIGDLVRYKFYDLDFNQPHFGIVLSIKTLKDEAIEYPYVVSYYHEYTIQWIGHTEATDLYEMFLEKYDLDDKNSI